MLKLIKTVRLRVLAAIVGLVGLVAAAVVTFVVEYFGHAAVKGPPVRVVVLSDPDMITNSDGPVGAQYWFDSSVDRLPRPPGGDSCVGRYEWARRHGGVDAGNEVVRVVVTNTGDVVLTVTGIQIKVSNRRPAAGGTIASCPGRGGGPSTVRELSTDLDQKHLMTRSVPAGSDRPDPTINFSIAPNSEQTFDIVNQELGFFCDWTADLRLIENGKDLKTVAINDRGRPFKEAGLGRIPVARWTGRSWSTTGG